MLRLSICCHPPPPIGCNDRCTTSNSNSLQLLIKYRKSQNPIGRIWALKDDGGTSSFQGRSWQPDSDVGVPFEQRPVNEYSNLKDSSLYSWADLGTAPFFLRLGGLCFGALTLLGIPIAASSFDPTKDPFRFTLAAGTGTLFLVSLIVLRIYLVLARDRLLGSYKVKPVVKMLKQTLVGIGALLVASLSLFVFATPVEDFFAMTRRSQSDGPASEINGKYSLRKEELLKLPVEVRTDDDLAAAAAKAADGRPAYCRDRYYRALAGGQYCKWQDLLD
ncbi:Protein CONSERVED IN THE GREEN LINEAGE AND DIATOMS 27, chloroplastic [Linum grandiflorum]